MSLKHEFTCDECKKKVKSNWNGAHHLPPKNWVQLYCPNEARMMSIHLCDKCRPAVKKYEYEIEGGGE